MLELLLVVVVCGILAWLITSLNIPQPFKNIALAILLIIVIVWFFRLILGVNFPLH